MNTNPTFSVETKSSFTGWQVVKSFPRLQEASTFKKQYLQTPDASGKDCRIIKCQTVTHTYNSRNLVVEKA
jgi:hypothetical protein